MTLQHRYAEVGVALKPPVELLVEQASRALARMKHVPHEAGPVRWHDPCQLGRGLGVYEAPRAVLGRALGRTPDEFDAHQRRELGACSGGGGLLPATMPEVARDIARTRLAAHTRLSRAQGERGPRRDGLRLQPARDAEGRVGGFFQRRGR